MTAEPFVHRLIRASAGSGKTHQLTNRYIGLLAAGVAPEAILASTFTRAAAGEIFDRVLLRLAKAAYSSDEAGGLSKQLGDDELSTIDFTRLLRGLLTRMHRVRVGTLDSYFIKLAGSMRFELGLPPGWSIGEDADNARLRLQALESLLMFDHANTLFALYDRLTKGDAKRGVQDTLLNVIDTLYTLSRETPAGIWNLIQAPEPMDKADFQTALDNVGKFDGYPNDRMRTACINDIDKLSNADWSGFLGAGIPAKIVSEQYVYSRTPISDPLIALYRPLMGHAMAGILSPIAEQNVATREFLDQFHQHLAERKAATGLLRFDEVTQCLVDGLKLAGIDGDTIAFRMNGRIEHLLLDEFQDTSLAQWRVLEPMTRQIMGATKKSKQSFFCVGDIKQAIYGWRGGLPALLGSLETALPGLTTLPINESRRSAPPIIETVNRLFEGIKPATYEKQQAGLAAWQERFNHHDTFRKKAVGYVLMKRGPDQAEGEDINGMRERHCDEAAGLIGDVYRKAPAATIGVLCRKNDTVARIIFELRHRGLAASEEGGNTLDDSPAVELMLSLFKITDHPGDSTCWYHLRHSPLGAHVDASPTGTGQRLRDQLMHDGYGRFTEGWARRLAPACDLRDLSRLQQLVELAYGYEERATLRADDFINRVREQRVPDPSAARIRVMTMHGSKGLQFDCVVLPELDALLNRGGAGDFVQDRDAVTLDATFVTRYMDQNTRALLPDAQRQAFDRAKQFEVEESLSLLYVALTRAKNAMYMLAPGKRRRESGVRWEKLLEDALGNKNNATANVRFECGTPAWATQFADTPAAAPPAEPLTAITFRTDDQPRRRGLKHLTPSQREGNARVMAGSLFSATSQAQRGLGTLVHAWYAAIEWLDDGVPGADQLKSIAEGLRAELPADVMADLVTPQAAFLKSLKQPQIAALLRRPTGNVTVERERRFVSPDGDTLWSGSFDRVVWVRENGKLVAAEIIDFKTDEIKKGGLKTRVGHYRPQMDAYRQSLARLSRLPVDKITVKLAFTHLGEVVELQKT